MSATRPCAHCLEAQVSGEESLCEVCALLPRCEVCEVFFDGLFGASKGNPRRCESCEHYELKIKFYCFLCGEAIPVYVSKQSKVLNYIVRGNGCGKCNAMCRTASRESKKEENPPQFVGYLAIIKNLFDAGVMGRPEWERTIRANKHDVMYRDGLDPHLFDEEVDLTDEN